MFKLEDVDKLIEQAIDKAEYLLKNNRDRESEIVLKQTLKVSPQNIKALQLLGLVYHKNSEYKKAIELFEKALTLDDNNPENHNNIALCYSCVGEIDKALEHMAKAVKIDPNKDIYWANFGLRHRQKGNYLEAKNMFEKAIEINNSSDNWSYLGNNYGEQNKIYEAIECFEEAVKLNQDSSSAHVDLSYGYLLTGQWAKAWAEYEYRLTHFPQVKIFTKLYSTEKRWVTPLKGHELQGKKVAVYCEQGNGDFIHFSRYLPLLKSKNCEVLLHCPPELINLFQHNNLGDKYSSEFKDEDCDLHCSILSLPYLLNIDVTTFNNEPYLTSNKNATFDDYKEFFKIGVAWGGNPRHPRDMIRSCKLSCFRDLSKIPEVKLFMLQKDIRKRAYSFHPEPIDLTEGCEDMRLVDLSEFMNDYNDTAALIKGLDLVISVDTSIVHMAGALGVPCWTLLAYNPDWRWGFNEKTFWYPSLRLFRQNKYDNGWNNVFSNLYLELKNELSRNTWHKN